MSLRVYFDIPHTYYVPQYAPVIEQLQQRGAECHAVVYDGNDIALKEHAASTLNTPCTRVKDTEAALELYRQQAPDWVVFGNDFHGLSTLADKTRAALLFHGSGTGVKRASLSPGLAEFDVRFVSGPGRMKIFAEHFPGVEMVEVGFAKLDPLRTTEGRGKAELDLAKLGLDESKPTLLYAPTFYPSSIENMSRHFPRDFAEYNILIKAHDFTLHKPRYQHQLKKLQSWSQASNVYFARPEEFSLVPFMGSADIMVTDTSSAIFEFASLNKPVVICDFVHLRWTYRGPFRYRLNKRLDPSTLHYQRVAAKAPSYKALKGIVEEHLNNPGLLESIRMEYASEIMGNMDGKASERIASYLIEHHGKA